VRVGARGRWWVGVLGRTRAGGRASLPPPAVVWWGVGAYGVEWAAGRRGVGRLRGYEQVTRERVTENLRHKN